MSLDMRIQATSLTGVVSVLTPRQFTRYAKGPVNEAMRKATVLVKNAARRELGSHRRTGKMRSRIRTKTWGGGAFRKYGVKSTGVGSNLIVGGVRPHSITAGGRVMPMWGGRGAWKRGQGSGIEGFARRVEHPGFPADPFFDRAIDQSAPEVNALLDAAARQIAANLAAAIGRA
jgi:hypothetical protein